MEDRLQQLLSKYETMLNALLFEFRQISAELRPDREGPKTGRTRIFDHQAMMRDYKAKMSQRQLSEKYGVSQSAISRAVKAGKREAAKEARRAAKEAKQPGPVASYIKDGSPIEYQSMSDGLVRFKPYPEAEWQATKRTAKELEAEGYVKSTCPPENS